MKKTDFPALHDPRVSVVICNYNYGRFLEKALDSAVNQTYPCEVVVVDDGSTDDSREILARWQERVKVMLQPNAGQRAAYHAGFAECTGDVVIFLDSDDYLSANAVASIVTAFSTGVVKVHYRMSLVDECGEPLGNTIPRALASGDVLPRLMRSGLLYASAPGSGNAYRRSALAQLFPLPSNTVDSHGADFFTIYGCIAFGDVRAIHEPLAAYRVHADPPAAAAGFVFGNAARRSDEPLRARKRADEFRHWISRCTANAVTVPPHLLDFSMEKTVFVHEVFEHPYRQGLFRGAEKLPVLFKSLWLHGEYSSAMKVGLSLWALLMLLIPRALGRPLARHVSNPASRRSTRRSQIDPSMNVDERRGR